MPPRAPRPTILPASHTYRRQSLGENRYSNRIAGHKDWPVPCSEDDSHGTSVAGIIANLHDVVIILGFFAFFQWEFSLSVLAAVLAVLGYSVNESVIIFDRVREKFRERHARNMTTAQVLDHAITTTTSRTVITHTSTLMMVLSMLFFGGPTLHYFSLALAIGICFGVYSSIFVASAIVYRMGVKHEDLMPRAQKPIDDLP